MFGPVMISKRLRFVVEIKIVGDEALAVCFEQLFDHRMAAAARSADRRASAVGLRGLRSRKFGARDNFLRRRGARNLRARRVARWLRRCGAGAGLRWAIRSRSSAEKAALDFEDAVVGIENFALVFLQFGRGETLGVDQRLLAIVIGGGSDRDWRLEISM